MKLGVSMGIISSFKALTKQKKLLLSLSAFILLILLITSQLLYSILTYDKIHTGTYIENINVSALTRDNASAILKEKLYSSLQKHKLTFLVGNKQSEIVLSEIGIEPQIEAALDKAYSIGHSGNLVSRFWDIFINLNNSKAIKIEYKLNSEAFDKALSIVYKEHLLLPIDSKIELKDKKVMLYSGADGKEIDTDALKQMLLKKLTYNSDISIDALFKLLPSKKLNFEDAFKQISSEPSNAYAVTNNNSIQYVEAIPGRKVDKNTLSSIIKELENAQGLEKELSIETIKPQITVNDIKPLIFKDLLSTASTQFYTGSENDRNRGENIRLGVSMINGKILGSGDTFSFNEVVGPRTQKEGYKIAKAYSDGKVIDDVGGGICQVSSTLFNASVLADMDIVSRTNHMFTVAYLPKGQDAAVAYNSVDFIFKNTSNYPIKIEAKVTADNIIIFNFYGTTQTPGKTIELSNKTVETLEAPISYIDDPLMAYGASYVKTNGMTGYMIDTYKIVKQNGVLVSESKLHSSYYQPLTTEIVRGTNKN